VLIDCHKRPVPILGSPHGSMANKQKHESGGQAHGKREERLAPN
jgi:hypothetical protein